MIERYTRLNPGSVIATLNTDLAAWLTEWWLMNLFQMGYKHGRSPWLHESLVWGTICFLELNWGRNNQGREILLCVLCKRSAKFDSFVNLIGIFYFIGFNCSSFTSQEKNQVRSYIIEAWCFNEDHVPTLEEYRKNRVFSCTYPLLTVSSLCGMGKIASKEVFDWLFTHPKILASTSDLFRLIDDVASHEVWNKLKKPVKIVKRTKLLSNLCSIRFYIAVWTRKRPCVECCMKQHGVSKQDAHDELTKLVESNPKGCSSIDQVLGLLPKGHQFEAHKPQGHWRLTWSLTSGSVRLVEVRANWSKHLY
jgi:hypothetical protein